MNPERWKRIDELFHAALELNPAERTAFLVKACKDDQALYGEIEALIASHGKESSLFENPPADLVADLLANEDAYRGTIAHYRIIKKIGSGGMGEVYLAEDTRLNRKVALKLLPKEFTKAKERIRRFEREARAVTALNHPYILTVYDIGEFNSSTFIASEFIDGETLRQKIQSSKIPLKEILLIVIQVAEALDAAHRAGIIHRDIKPENVMLRKDGYVKVLDFGLSKPIEDSMNNSKLNTITATDTQAGVVIGTIRYMSPEQARGLKLDPRTDIFSLGVVLYEMIAGRAPFEGVTLTDVLAAILEKQPAPLRSFGNFPDELQWCVSKALAKDKDERYQNAADFVTDLKGIRKKLEIDEELKRLGSAKTHVNVQRITASKKSLAITSIILLTIALLSIYFVHQSQRAPSATAAKLMTQGVRPSIAVIGFKNLSGSNDTTWISAALSEMLSTELAVGEKLLVISGEEISRSRKELSLEQADSYSTETLVRIRKNLPADYLILGAYYVPPGQKQIRLDLNVQKTEDGQITTRFTETRNELDLLSLVLSAGTHLRQSLGIVPLSVQQINTARSSLSSNPDAVRFYTEGLAQLRELDRRGARELMLKAAKADPTFPLAYSALSQTWLELGYTKNAIDSAKTALDLSSNLSREERLLVEARYYRASGNWQSAIQSYQSLFTFFPDNLEYGLLLVEVQSKAGFIADADETIKLLRKLPSPINEDPRIDLAELYNYEIFDPDRYLKLARTAVERARLRGASLLEAQALTSLGTALMIQNQKNESIASFKAAKQIYAKQDRKGDILVVENRLANALRNSGDFEAALQSEELQLQKYNELGEKYNVAMSYWSIGQIQIFLGKTDDALKSFSEAKTILEEIGNRNNIGFLYDSLARVYSNTGELTKSEQYHTQAIELLKDSPGDLRDELSSLASIKKRMGDKVKARQLYDQALEINRNLKSKKGVADCLVSISLLSKSETDLRSASEYLEQLSKGYKKEKNVPGELEALKDLEEIYGAQNDVVNTTRVIREKLPLIRTIRNPGQRAGELQDCAFRFADFGLFKEAETLAEEIINSNKENISAALFIQRNVQWLTGDVTKLKTTLAELKKPRPGVTWIGKTYVFEREAMLNFECGDLSQAQKQFDEILKQATAVNNFEFRLRAISSLAELAAARGEYQKAEQLLQQASPKIKEQGSEELRNYCHEELGKYYFSRGKFKDAEKEWTIAADYYKSGKIPQDEKTFLAKVAHCRILQGDFVKAEEILKGIDETDPQIRENFWDVTDIRQAKARLLSSQKKYEEAIQLLNPIIKKAGQENLIRVMLETNSILAEVKIASGKKAEGISLLQSVEKEARNHGFINIADRAIKSLSRSD